MQNYMGENKVTTEHLEQIAEKEYNNLKGRLVRVCAINGHAYGVPFEEFHIDMNSKPVIVRILEASLKDDIHRWMDEAWLDPVYPVEIVKRGNLPESLSSCWIYGNCRNLKGDFELGDIIAVLEPDIVYDIDEHLGGKRCEPPEKYRHLMGFMRPPFKHVKKPHCSDCNGTGINYNPTNLACVCKCKLKGLSPKEIEEKNIALQKEMFKTTDRAVGIISFTKRMEELFTPDEWKRFVTIRRLNKFREQSFRNWCCEQGINLDNPDPKRLEKEYFLWGGWNVNFIDSLLCCAFRFIDNILYLLEEC